MPGSSSSLTPASEAVGDRSEETLQLISGAIPLIGKLLGALLGPTAYQFGSIIGWLSGTEINTFLLDFLPNNTLKNGYVAGIVGFFLVINFLAKIIPSLSPVAVPIADFIALFAALFGAISGFLADAAGGIQVS